MTGHDKRIDDTVPFVAVNIAILTVSDSRTIADDKSGDLLVANAVISINDEIGSICLFSAFIVCCHLLN